MSPGVLGPIREVLSPYKIAVLIFIEKYNRIGLKYGDALTQGIVGPEISTTERKATAHLLFRLVQGGDMTYSELSTLVALTAVSTQHSTDWRTSLQELLYQGVDGLMNLFDAVNKAVLQDRHDTWPCIWTSIVGLFLRQMSLLYKRLAFTEIVALHTHLIKYCKLLHKTNKTCQSSTGTEVLLNLSSALDITMGSPPGSPSILEDGGRATEAAAAAEAERSATATVSSRGDGLACSWSVQQAELVIGEQTQLLEYNESSAMDPKQLHDTLQQILAAHPHLSAAHYLSCLNYLRVNEARGSVESLAAAYDCQQVTRATPRTLRYAALNMASLYSHFGSKAVALRCVSEAISQSQEAGDNTCLQHALAWLYALAPHNKRDALIQSAVQRSSSLQLPYLSWLSLINQSAHNTGKHPHHHLQMLVSRVDGCVGVPGDTGGVWGVEAGVWLGWLGSCSTMATVCSQLVLHAPPTLKHDTPHAASHTAGVLANIAQSLADMGEGKLSQSLLSYSSRLFPNSGPHAHYLRKALAHILCTQFMLEAKYTVALRILEPMAAENPIFVKIRSCEIAINQGEAETALHLISELQRIEEVKNKAQLQVQVQLLHVSALSVAGTFAPALTTVVGTMALAKENHLALLHALCCMHVLALQLSLSLLKTDCRPRKGYETGENPSIHAYNYYNISPLVDIEMLDKAMSVINSSGSVYDRARSLLVIAKVRAQAVRGQKEKISRVAKSLDRIKEMFIKINAPHRLRDVLYLSARLWNDAGNVEARNRSSCEFRKLEESMPNKNLIPKAQVF